MSSRALLSRALICTLPLCLSIAVSIDLRADCENITAAYWSLDETSGTTFADSAGSGHDATCSTCPTPTTGQIDGAQAFTAASLHQISLADATGLNAASGESFSFEAWIRPTVSPPAALQIFMGQSNGAPGATTKQRWLGITTAGKLWWFLDDGPGTAMSTCVGATTLTAGNWHHVVGVRNAATNEVILYLNGVADGANATKTYSGTLGFEFLLATGFDIGHLQSGFHFGGSIDGVAVHDEALSAAAVISNRDLGLAGDPICVAGGNAPPVITSIPVTTGTVDVAYSYDVNASGTPAPTYSLSTFPTGMTINSSSGLISWTPSAGQVGPNSVVVVATNSEGSDDQDFIVTVTSPPPCHEDLIAFYSMDDDATSEFFGTNDAACSSCPTDGTGQINGAQLFTTASLHDVSVADATDFDAAPSTSFSFEAWIQPTVSPPTSLQIFMGQSDGAPAVNIQQRWLGLRGTGADAGKLWWFLDDGPLTGATAATTCIGSTVLTAGNWYHVVGVRNAATNQVILYVNGAVDGAGATKTLLGTADFQFPAATPFDIGHLQEGFHFGGSIDSVAIYDDALSLAEISSLYADGLAGIPVCEDACPSISVNPSSEVACVGDDVTLTVSASGSAPLSYQWFKNNILIGGATSSSLLLTNIQTGDAGTYKVTVSNDCVDVATSTDAVVTVKTPVSISGQPTSTSACVGQPYSFSVTASGTATLTYQWRKNGSPIGGATSASYSVLSADFADDGALFSCAVTNDCGTLISSNGVLTVKEPVSITGQPTGATVCEGDPISLSVRATGTATITYQWRKNGTPIGGATNASYSIPSAVGGDSGAYTCVVTNDCGSQTSAVATVTVEVPPSITLDPVSQSASIGSTVNFTCAASGTEPITFQWRKNSSPIGGATNSSYSIPAVAEADAGSYDCVVTNSCGSDTSAAAILTVTAAPIITSHPTDVEVCVGGTATFTVAAIGSNPLSFQWEKNGSPIGGATSASLSINPVAAADAGDYRCVVENDFGDATSDPATLTVLLPPSITTQPADSEGCIGSGLTLSVVANGAGLAYQWRKNGSAIGGATSASLSFASLVLGDAGSYDCEITGTCGATTSTAATLTVSQPPSILTHPSSDVICVGEAAAFSVVASGTGPFTYQWRKNGSPIGGATAALYTIATTVAGDAASYTCTVTGPCGFVTSNAATLGFGSPPSVTTQPTGGEFCDGDPISLSVVATGFGTLSYQWRKDGSPIGGATSAAFSIPSAAISDGASYDCVVTGDCGSVTSAAAIVVVGSGPEISTQPSSSDVCVGQPAVFAVVASGQGALSYQWRKAGSPISGATSSTFSIAAVVAASAGSYDCVVTDDCGSTTSTAATLTVGEPATIVTHPSSDEICVGDAAAFSVVVSSVDPVTYQWRKNGAPISGATSATYAIAAAVAGDAGSYDCVVTAPCGPVTSNAATLSFGNSPSITTQPSGGDFCEGDPVTLSVVATGFGALTYQWRKDGSPIGGATSASFSIASLSVADAASYDCEVSGECGAVTSAAASVVVGSGPQIVAQPSSVEICNGLPAAFSVAAAGQGALSFQWRHDGAPISGATSSSYAIAAAGAGDLGSYDCVVTDDCGSVTSSAATLSFGAGPSIVEHPQGSSVCGPGQSATFSVVANGGALPITYQWRKDGSPIGGANSDTYSIDPVTVSDEGSYDCVVTTACGSTASNAATLEFKILTEITLQPSGGEVCEGSDVMLSVEAIGSGVLVYQWRKDGGVLAGATGPSFLIADADPSDAGSYDCAVTGECNAVVSSAAVIVVKSAPVITLDPISTEVCVDSTLSLSVEATGSLLTYQWRLDGVPLSGETGPTLTVPSITLADAGSYDCVVTGECGAVASAVAVVSIAATPVIDDEPVGATLCPGASVTLTVVASGLEPLVYQWRKDGSVLAGATSSSFEITDFSASVAGSYDVVVTNPCGSVASVAVDVALTLDCGGTFVRGDANQDDRTDISDAISILDYLFRGTNDPTCLLALNVNDDGSIDLSDPVFLLNWMFRGGPDIPSPNRDTGCGTDTTPADAHLTCLDSTCF
jgi:hypothetical protein